MNRQSHDSGRRDFLARGLAGLAGAAVLPSALRGHSPETEPAPKKERKIVTRVLGRTGIAVPVVSMGGQSNSPELMRAALDAGIRHIDTANSYFRGRHEEAVAQAIKGRPRDSFVIGTKAYVSMDQRTGLYPPGTTAAPLLEKFDLSLKRLGLDYVDIFYLHDVVRRESALCEPLLGALVKLREQGKARAVGLTVHSNEPEVIHAAVDSKVYDVVLTSYNFRQPHVAEMQQAIARAAGAGLGILAMKTMAGVFWDPERQQPINLKAALKWVLQNENVHTTVPGFTSFEQMELDLSVMEDLKLTAQERQDLRLGEEKKVTGLYCSQCRRCLAQCPAPLDIPALMRGYMYAYGYRNLAQAKETLAGLDPFRLPCRECAECAVRCTMGFPVRDRAMDIARLGSVPDEFIG